MQRLVRPRKNPIALAGGGCKNVKPNGDGIPHLETLAPKVSKIGIVLSDFGTLPHVFNNLVALFFTKNLVSNIDYFSPANGKGTVTVTAQPCFGRFLTSRLAPEDSNTHWANAHSRPSPSGLRGVLKLRSRG